MRLLVITHVTHYIDGSRIFAYGPYAREIDIWATLFDKLLIAAPFVEAPPPGSAESLHSLNVEGVPLQISGGNTWRAKCRLALELPAVMWKLAISMYKADAIHVRCPGNLGLVGALMAPLFSSCLVAKYAGQWTSYPGEPVTFRFQRWLLGSRWWRGPVTVYGSWPNQPPHVVPFFTSMMTDSQVDRAIQHTSRLQASEGQLRVIFIGRLTRAKNVHILLDALGLLPISFSLLVVGEGPERTSLQAQAQSIGIGSHVEFSGGVSSEKVFDLLETAEVCVLASESEGWPKALTEAMAFGLVCIGSDRGLVPELLADGRGIVVPAGDAIRLAQALLRVSSEREELLSARRRAAAWAQQYSRERLRQALALLLRQRWPHSATQFLSTCDDV